MKKPNKHWCAGYVNAATKEKAPSQWFALWKTLLKRGAERKLLQKAEAASMVIRGKRIERWLINKSDHEYASKKDALRATQKLIYQAIISNNSPYSIKQKASLLRKIACAQNGCLLSIGHSGRHIKKIENKLYCGICGEIISYQQIMGKGRASRGSKIDPKVCNMGHIDPLTSGGKHNAENIGWQHKSCNDCQGNLNRSDFLKLLSQIIKFHKKPLNIQRKHI